MVNTRRSGPISPQEEANKRRNVVGKVGPPNGAESLKRSRKRQRVLDSPITPEGVKTSSRQPRGKPAKNGDGEYNLDVLSPPKTRSRSNTRSLEHRNNGSIPNSLGEGHKKGGRQKVSSSSPRRTMQISNRPRRSDRQRRIVYGTLNENVLKQQQSTSFCDGVLVDEAKGQEQTDSPDAGSDEFVNMYDRIKKKHDTPSPEKTGKSYRRKDLDSDGDDEEEDSDDEVGEVGEDEDEEEEEEGDEESQRKRYLLRQKKPVTNRYTAPPMRTSRERRHSYVAFTGRLRRRQEQPPHASPVRRIHRRRRNTINKGSSTSSSDESCDQDERKFERRKSRSMAKARERCLPMNFVMGDLAGGVLNDRRKVGSSLADVDPMNIDRKVTFESVGGLGSQIRALKEMILFPLMYTEVFEKFKITPPRGVLFHGPPGTGKTLVARALANECSKGGKKVAFFMRKGADCLSKWVGESERQLRLLFDQAFSMRPSIIFFDEIDGLAPVRSSRQDQIHSSIVSTLLALMDGLDSRGELVVIGATNRIDAIDPALRRPGRFDREFQFTLPDKKARRAILSIHTREWEPKLLPAFVSEMADRCVGYCGADIKALCTEAALLALRRRYPQIYTSDKKLLLDVDSIEITARDFDKAMQLIVPASQRSAASPARVLPSVVRPLLAPAFHSILDKLKTLFSPVQLKSVPESAPCGPTENPTSRSETQSRALSEDEDTSDDDDNSASIFEPRAAPGSTRSARYTRRMRQRVDEQAPPNRVFFSGFENLLRSVSVYRPRLLICGKRGMGQSTHLAPALLHAAEHVAVRCLDLPTLYGSASKTPEEACAQSFREARRTAPCVLYVPHVDAVWAATADSLHCTFLSLLHDLPPAAPVLLLATADRPLAQLPPALQQLFSKETGQVFTLTPPNCQERTAFFQSLFLELALQTSKPKTARKEKIREVLPVAPTPPPRQLTELELQKVREDEENTLRELRIFLREIHTKLLVDRRFKEFSKPVDLEEIPDYRKVVDEPMDLATILQKVDSHAYMTCKEYLRDIDLVTSNALQYNPTHDQLGKTIRQRACELCDYAHSAIRSQLEPEFEKACEDIIASRERRGEDRTSGAPAYVNTSPEKTGHRTSETALPAEGRAEGRAEVSTQSSADTRQEAHKGPDAAGAEQRKRAPRRLYPGGRRKRRRITRRALNMDDGSGQGDGDEGDAAQDDEPTGDGERGQSDGEHSDGANHDKSHAAGENGDGRSEETALALPPASDDESLRSGGVNADSEVNFVGDDAADVALLCDVDELSDSKGGGEEAEERVSRASPGGPGQNMSCGKSSDAHLPNGICLGSDGQGTLRRPDIEPSEERLRSTNTTCGNGMDGTENSEQHGNKLRQLLGRLVDATHSASVECLETYHSALQQCIYQHRHSQDKTQLVKDLDRMVQTFSNNLHGFCFSEAAEGRDSGRSASRS